MTMRIYAVIDDATGRVTNRIVLDDVEKEKGWSPGDGLTLVGQEEEAFEIGGVYLDGGYTPPPSVTSPPLIPETISDRQFFQKLAAMNLITQDDALNAVKTGFIPATLQVFVDTLPVDQKFAAEMLIAGATQFDRHHPMTLALAQGMGWTDAQLDALWTAASAL